MKKEIQIIMLPTQDKTDIIVNIYRKELNIIVSFRKAKELNSYNPVKQLQDRGYKHQHLYFVSDEEIKAMDYWINLDDNSINNRYAYAEIANNAPSCKKIIATTDKSLKRDITDSHKKHSNTLPQPPQEFIEEYCRKGGIDKVMVLVYVGGSTLFI